VFGERPISNLARELLHDERGRPEDEALKLRAMERARAALGNERPSGIGFTRPSAAAQPSRPRRWTRALPLAAAALGVAGLAAAGVSDYLDSARVEVRPQSLRKWVLPRSRNLAMGGALLGPSPSSAPALERAHDARPVGPALDAEAKRAPNVREYATELALLEPARSSIGRGDYRTALSAIDRHRLAFPQGQLREEREALRVRALWGLGQRQTALAAAKVFRKRFPRSGLLSWLNAETEQAP
jgi:hypothetical protein